jgi:hypothetical protein
MMECISQIYGCIAVAFAMSDEELKSELERLRNETLLLKRERPQGSA